MSSASLSSWVSLDGIQLRKSGERGCASRVPSVGPHVEGAVGLAGLADHALVVGQHVSCDCVEDPGRMVARRMETAACDMGRHGGAIVAPAGCVRWGADECAF
jgi:hypothetical protein